MIGYTTRANIESFAGKTYPVTDAVMNRYIEQAEDYIDRYLGYDAQTTTSGILTQVITREKIPGKIDPFGNLVIDVYHAPVHIDEYGNPAVTYLEYSQGGIHIPMQLTDGQSTSGRYYSLLDLSENGRKLVYPSLYFFPAISTVTPTAKVNLNNLRDVRFFTTITYTGGYDSVPASIESAANLLVLGFLQIAENPNLAEAVRQGSFSINYFSAKQTNNLRGQTPFIARANELLQPFLRVTW